MDEKSILINNKYTTDASLADKVAEISDMAACEFFFQPKFRDHFRGIVPYLIKGKEDVYGAAFLWLNYVSDRQDNKNIRYLLHKQEEFCNDLRHSLQRFYNSFRDQFKSIGVVDFPPMRLLVKPMADFYSVRPEDNNVTINPYGWGLDDYSLYLKRHRRPTLVHQLTSIMSDLKLSHGIDLKPNNIFYRISSKDDHFDRYGDLFSQLPSEVRKDLKDSDFAAGFNLTERGNWMREFIEPAYNRSAELSKFYETREGIENLARIGFSKITQGKNLDPNFERYMKAPEMLNFCASIGLEVEELSRMAKAKPDVFLIPHHDFLR